MERCEMKSQSPWVWTLFPPASPPLSRPPPVPPRTTSKPYISVTVQSSTDRRSELSHHHPHVDDNRRSELSPTITPMLMIAGGPRSPIITPTWTTVGGPSSPIITPMWTTVGGPSSRTITPMWTTIGVGGPSSRPSSPPRGRQSGGPSSPIITPMWMSAGARPWCPTSPAKLTATRPTAWIARELTAWHWASEASTNHKATARHTHRDPLTQRETNEAIAPRAHCTTATNDCESDTSAANSTTKANGTLTGAAKTNAMLSPEEPQEAPAPRRKLSSIGIQVDCFPEVSSPAPREDTPPLSRFTSIGVQVEDGWHVASKQEADSDTQEMPPSYKPQSKSSEKKVMVSCGSQSVAQDSLDQDAPAPLSPPIMRQILNRWHL
uniref:Uncharacterized protein n=1 Tax=Knipowitschia caucasica TaxID=637954 RepID=A0AAV2M5L6_KNICA